MEDNVGVTGSRKHPSTLHDIQAYWGGGETNIRKRVPGKLLSCTKLLGRGKLIIPVVSASVGTRDCDLLRTFKRKLYQADWGKG